MAAELYRVRQSSRPAIAAELLFELRTISESFARLKLIFAAMTQQKDDTTDYTTVANTFAFVGSDGTTITEQVAEDAYDEINSFIGNGGPILEQCCARFRQ